MPGKRHAMYARFIQRKLPQSYCPWVFSVAVRPTGAVYVSAGTAAVNPWFTGPQKGDRPPTSRTTRRYQAEQQYRPKQTPDEQQRV